LHLAAAKILDTPFFPVEALNSGKWAAGDSISHNPFNGDRKEEFGSIKSVSIQFNSIPPNWEMN
jgi:hypothetical protein